MVLELAAAVGDTGFDAAELIGDEGRLISSDFSPKMLEAARRRGAERGVANAEYRVIDAERIELDDDSVDGVLCRYGYMLMADPPRRWPRRAACCVRGAGSHSPSGDRPSGTRSSRSSAASWSSAATCRRPSPAGARHLRMGSAERTAQLLEGPGSARSARRGRGALPGADVAEYLEFTADTAGPIAIAVRGLSEEDCQALEPELEEALGPFCDRRRLRAAGRHALRSGEMRARLARAGQRTPAHVPSLNARPSGPIPGRPNPRTAG